MCRSQPKAVFFDKAKAVSFLPKRDIGANKGSFGKTLIIAGSEKYMGAGLLALEAALRGGAGYVGYLNEPHICDNVLLKYPEAIYHRISLSDIDSVLSVSAGYCSVLVGPGLGCSECVAHLVQALVTSEGGALIIDADGLNSISKFIGADVLKNKKREVIITPHPLEFARLNGMPGADSVNADRTALATSFAKKYGITVLLKGQGTVVTDGDRAYINASGGVALAKAGSGDVLAGLLASLSAFMPDKTLAAILSAFIHGYTADRLSSELSSFGVIPSDLPRAFAGTLNELEKERKI